MAPEAASEDRGDPGAPDGTSRECLLSSLMLLGFALALILNLSGQAQVPRGGWDETTHLQLPAARMLVSLQEGRPGQALAALQDCSQYPFVAPVYLAAVQGLFGLSEGVARWAILALWIATLAGLIVLGFGIRSCAAGPRPVRGAGYVALLTPLVLAFASPLGTRYAGTLFLEVPIACAFTWTLVAWFRRRERPSLRRDVVAGAWITLTLFTKFNYGVLLAAGLGFDWLLERPWRASGEAGGRQSAARAWVRSLLGLGLVPLVVGLWWFVLPLPEGLERAAQHRASFLAYLVAERGTEATPWARRLVDWAGGVAPNPVVLGLTLVGVLASFARLSRPCVRCLLCVLVATGPAVWSHPFHLDRFLLPGAIPLWLASGAGWYVLAQRFDLWRDGQSALASSMLVFVVGFLIAFFPLQRLVAGVGLFSDDAQVRAYQESALDELSWSGRVPSAGLSQVEHRQLVDWVEAELEPGERFAWIGLTSELSPASVHLELLARGGDRERFLRDAGRQIDITPVPGMPDPGWSVEQLERFLEPFDVVFMTHPPDLKGRPGADFIEDRYQRPLIDTFGYGVEQLGSLDIADPPGDPVEVTLYALRAP